MNINKLNLDKCIVFPRSMEAVRCLEEKRSDSRVEIDYLDMNYQQFNKLLLNDFFLYPIDGVVIKKGMLVKISEYHLTVVIEFALQCRKEVSDVDLLKLIDKFVQKTSISKKSSLPIWVNT